MNEQLRKKIVYAALVVAVIWGAYNFSGRSATVSEAAPSETIQPANRIAGSAPTLSQAEVDRVKAADWGRDPFGAVKAGRRAPGPSWTLRGIIYSDTSPMAYVNGKRVRIGDTVDRATVTAISRTAVTLRYQGKDFDIHVQKG